MHIYNINGRGETVNILLFGLDLKIFYQNMGNELFRLAQGNTYGEKAIDTVNVITKEELPIYSKVAYANFVCDYKTLKSKPHRVILAAGGNKLESDGGVGAPAASLIATKLLNNSVVS